MFGFGKGSIEIQLEKYNFSPGETINGTVVLKLKKPIEAKGLTIRFVGEQTTKTMTRGTNRRIGNQGQMEPGFSHQNTSKRKIFDFSQPLDNAKSYSIGEQSYKFEIKIPQDLVGRMPEGTLGNIVKAATILSGNRNMVKWFLIAELDVPWSLDVRERVQINIA